MLLAIDIGNTNINLGIIKGGRIFKKFFIPTQGYKLSRLKSALRKFTIDRAIISSVVPSIGKILQQDLKKYLHQPVYMAGKDIAVPIKNCYRNPKEVGQDRLVNAYAGISRYGAPLIVVDFGTAITFDVISKDQEYLGGMILPGLDISLDALAQRTALLPKIKLALPKEFIGRNTVNSMTSGIIYGFASLTDELAKRIKVKIGKSAKVIGTGGNIELIAEYCNQFDVINPNLTLLGLSDVISSKLPVLKK